MNKLPIHNADDALKIGGMIARSGTFGVNSDEAGAMIALMCFQEDMGLLEFHRTYHMVDNKPTMRSDAMVAKFLNLGGKFEIVERSETRAAAKLWKEGSEPREFSITIDEVKKAGYCFKKDGKTMSRNWEIRPKNMLWARMVSDAIRLLEPRVNAGIYTQEEIGDEAHEEEAPQPKEQEPKPKPTPEDPFKDLPDKKVDYSIAPFGKIAGKPWLGLPRETLEAVLENPRGLDDPYIEEVKKALENTPF